ncbi:carbonic anhydrase family protein [Aquimarina sp. RZ0]|uniref:carbonic anhydrase family protein n=1 Tax=Aquimarina sp. RZ0 TaxID=2607730 RepID=UPI0011F2B3B4|nr:carbonic anhydrase family protein [Aquimarina sp. RZ0]KAA1247614.1 carbonic anhydrase [Aquimarina sp. RZ0]
MKAHTKETQAAITPQIALELLKEGNKRFQNSMKADRNLLGQIKDTKAGQYPFATILSCIDSRVSSELIFDQGIGDIFSARVAGNFVNEDILGSMEFASKLAGTRLILVLGHTSCGAVKGAVDNAKLGNLTALLSKIKPAVAAVTEPSDASLRTSKNIEFVNEVAVKNVYMTIENIRAESSVLREMEENKEILIIGGMYDISTGGVTFFEN